MHLVCCTTKEKKRKKERKKEIKKEGERESNTEGKKKEIKVIKFSSVWMLNSDNNIGYGENCTQK